MKNRFCRMGKTLLGAACLLSTFGVTYSCSDDYDLPDTKPSFLGQSIYDELNKAGNFKTVIRLIDDLGQTSVLSKTGSKTLFVAPDSAYTEYFRKTDPNFTSLDESYAKLSINQKRMLLNGSMINNAYVLEKLTTIEGPVKNLCLRQTSASSATDSIPYWNWQDLPDNQNKGQKDENGKTVNADMRFWDKLRNEAHGGIYMALDGTNPLLTHFLEAQMNEKKIKNSDISFILNLDGTPEAWDDSETAGTRSYFYDARVVKGKQDVTCLNGYYNVLDKVLVTPSNMAEVIRTNGDTKYFSAMLDRFSAPFFDRSLTDAYKLLNDIKADSVYKKIYIAERSSMTSLTQGPNKESLNDFPFLPFDPGWNQYTVNQSTKEQDMAAMFVPCDEAMANYFVHGGGKVMIERYGDMKNNEANLLHNLYQIPLNVIQPLIKNLMKESFNESVPSKYLTIMNDAQDPMFAARQYPSVDAYKANFKKVLLANNGVVYVMKSVISPATYASVMAPVLYDKSTQVVNTVLHADDAFTTDKYAQAPLRKFYSTYLLAMQSSFSFFVPTDEGLKTKGYIDPVAMANTGVKAKYAYWTFEPASVTAKDGKYLAIKAQGYPYDPTKDLDPANTKPKSGYQSLANEDLGNNWAQSKKFMLCEMIDHHILVHDNDDQLGVRGERHYFLSRNGAPVHVKSKGNNDGLHMEVEGGLQMDLKNDDQPANDQKIEVTKVYDMTRQTNEYGNGTTYYINRPMQASQNTVYGAMQKHEQFSSFFKLCNDLSSNIGSSMLETLFRTADMKTNADWRKERNKYYIFADNAASSSDNPGARITATQMKLVRFFNSYRYSVYVPNNDAIDKAVHEMHLPTVQSIQAYIDAHTDENKKLDSVAKIKAQAMVVTLVNFLKYHFADQSLFVDQCTASTECQSACSDEETGGFIRLTAKQTPGKLDVVDVTGNSVPVSSSLNNICTREFELNSVATSARYITNSSYVTLHSLGDNFLLFSKKVKGDFAKAWETVGEAKAFAKKYRIKN